MNLARRGRYDWKVECSGLPPITKKYTKFKWCTSSFTEKKISISFYMSLNYSHSQNIHEISSASYSRGKRGRSCLGTNNAFDLLFNLLPILTPCPSWDHITSQGNTETFLIWECSTVLYKTTLLLTSMSFPNNCIYFWYYLLPLQTTWRVKLRKFQYKILHRILPTKGLFFKMKTATEDKRSFCHTGGETLEHLFAERDVSQSYWVKVRSDLSEKWNEEINFTTLNILLSSLSKEVVLIHSFF